MGISGGPNIVQDGLVLLLDPSNKKSYPGSGTVWYDLSGRDNHFDLINSPVVVDNFFDFSTDEYATKLIAQNNGEDILVPDLVPVNQSFTVEVVYKFAVDSYRKKFIGTGNYGSGGWNLGVGYNSFNSIEFSAYNPNCDEYPNCQYNRGNISVSRDNNTTDFNFIQVIYDVENTTSKMYVNGQSLISRTASVINGTGPRVGSFRIGKNMQGGWSDMKGYCGIVKFYNRALTQSEVQLNFNSFLQYYGI